MINIVVVGQNPGNNKSAHYYKNHTMDRLKQWMSDIHVQFFSFVNCLHDKGQTQMKDVDYDFLYECVKDADKIIALGNFASACLEHINISHYKLPHPSPRNRVLNDKMKLMKTLEECERFVHE